MARGVEPCGDCRAVVIDDGSSARRASAVASTSERASDAGAVDDDVGRSVVDGALSDLDYFAPWHANAGRRASEAARGRSGEPTVLVPRRWDDADDDYGDGDGAGGGRVMDAAGGSGVIDVLPRDDDGATRMRIENELEDLYYHILDAEFELVESKLATWTVGEVVGGARDAASRAATHVRERVAVGARLTRRVLEGWAPKTGVVFSRGARRVGVVARVITPGRLASATATALRRVQFIPSPIVRVRVVAKRNVRTIFTHAARDLLGTGQVLTARLIAAPTQPFRLLFRVRPRRKKHTRSRAQEAPAQVDELDAESTSPTSPRRVYMRDLREIFEQAGQDFFSPSSLVLAHDENEEIEDLERVEVNEVSSVPTPQTVNIVIDKESSASSSEDSDADHLIMSARREVQRIHQASRIVKSERAQSAHLDTFSDDNDDLQLVSHRVLSVDDVTLGAQVLRHWLAAIRRGLQEPRARITREALEIMANSVLSPVERARRVFAFEDDEIIDAKPPSTRSSRFANQNRQLPSAVAASKNVYSFGEHESPHTRERSVSSEIVDDTEPSVSGSSAIEDVDDRISVSDEIVSTMRAEMKLNEERLESEMRELPEQVKRAKDEQAEVILLADNRLAQMQQSLETPLSSSEFDALKAELDRVKEEQQKSLRLIEERDAQVRQSLEAEKANLVVSAQLNEFKLELDRVRSEQATAMARAEERESELRKAFEAERHDLEQSLRQSFAAERTEFEEQLSKSLALELGLAERVRDEEGVLQEFKKELARVRNEQASALQQASKREDELRASFSLERQTLEEEVIRINARAIERIEAMKRENENVIRSVEKRAEHAERVLQSAETFAHETESKLKMREEALLKLTSTPTATFSPFSNTAISRRYTPLERARSRRRLLHGVPENHFISSGIEKLVGEANQLARDIQYSMK